ncbi:MAG: hypothetical protein ABMB14_12320 [Myxococcota bacterium]
MPFELWVRRGDRGGIPAPALRALLAGAPANLQPDGVYRLRRPDNGEPWVTVRHAPADGAPDAHGTVIVAASYTNPRFLRDAVDAFQLARRLGEALDGEVTDALLGERIAFDRLDAVLAPGTPLVTALADAHRDQMLDLARLGRIPLEWPLSGTIDSAPVRLIFQVRTAEPPSLDWVRGPPWTVEVGAPGIARLSDATWPVLRVELRPAGPDPAGRAADHALWITGAYSRAPFAVWAPAAAALADRVADAHRGTIDLVDVGPWTAAIRAERAPLLAGLGVDYVARYLE